jgi:branched-chain amino acid transport system ATP-binding protein
MTTPLLTVHDLRAGYGGIPVVFGIDLEVREGEVVALLGANGAGKTTTLRAISGMIKAMAGEVTFAGETITRRPADRIARSGMVHVPEGRGIFPSLRVDETLRLAASRSGASRGDASARIQEAYATFPRLAERKSQTAGTLSGGEQQMLTLARGLIAQPRLLLIDEMSQGLAPTVVKSLLELVSAFRERGVAVLLVEQFIGQALAIADRAYVLEKGEVTYAGSAQALAADEDFVRSSYLGDRGAETADGARRRRSVEVEVTLAGTAAAVPATMPPVLVRALEELSRRDGVPVEELVRRALVESVAADATKTPAMTRGGHDGA